LGGDLLSYLSWRGKLQKSVAIEVMSEASSTFRKKEFFTAILSRLIFLIIGKAGKLQTSGSLSIQK
jgi:hypothetical protein